MLTPVLVIGCLLAGQSAGDAASKTAVLKLVHKLDADTQVERQDAEEKLMKLGPAILDYLPSPESQPDAGVRDALVRIRTKLQQIQAAKSVEASTVTLQGRLKLSQVLAEIQKQTGNKIADLPQAAVPDAEIPVHFAKTPFWTALDSVLDQAQLSIYSYGQPVH